MPLATKLVATWATVATRLKRCCSKEATATTATCQFIATMLLACYLLAADTHNNSEVLKVLGCSQRHPIRPGRRLIRPAAQHWSTWRPSDVNSTQRPIRKFLFISSFISHPKDPIKTLFMSGTVLVHFKLDDHHVTGPVAKDRPQFDRCCSETSAAGDSRLNRLTHRPSAAANPVRGQSITIRHRYFSSS